MDTPSSGLDAMGRATYKLRQADLMLHHLRQVPAEIAVDMRRARAVSNPDLRLDTFFFSCLGLCKSSFNIIREGQGGRYKNAIGRWRDNVLDDKGRTHFDRMMKLRDKDVHQGQSDGKALGAMIPIERRNDDDAWIYQQHTNYAVLGISRHATQHENPDGRTVRSYEGLQSSMCLYIEIAGQTWEASNACGRFIEQLRQLIDSVGAANV
jgi:hypothetical protein